MVNNVRAALRDFVDAFAVNALFLQILRRAAGGGDGKAALDEQTGDVRSFGFVFVAHADEDFATRCGQAFAGAARGLMEGFGEGGAEAHDFACGFHFRA